jgi:hypothetical protein
MGQSSAGKARVMLLEGRQKDVKSHIAHRTRRKIPALVDVGCDLKLDIASHHFDR